MNTAKIHLPRQVWESALQEDLGEAKLADRIDATQKPGKERLGCHIKQRETHIQLL